MGVRQPDSANAEKTAVSDDMTGFQRDILFVIADFDGMPGTGQKAPKGLAIKSRLEDAYGEPGGVNHGRLYPNLDSLIGMGLVVKEAKDRRTNAYCLTDDGLATIRRQIAWEMATLTREDESGESVTKVPVDAKNIDLSSEAGQ